MKLKTLAISAAVALTAVAANAAVVQNSYSAELTNLYATHLNGTNYSVKDGVCKDQFGQFLGKTVSGQYAIDTAANAAEGTVSLDGQQTAMLPLQINGEYAFVADLPTGLTDRFVRHIHVTPDATGNATRAEVLLQPTPSQFLCVASTHTPNAG